MNPDYVARYVTPQNSALMIRVNIFLPGSNRPVPTARVGPAISGNIKLELLHKGNGLIRIHGLACFPGFLEVALSGRFVDLVQHNVVLKGVEKKHLGVIILAPSRSYTQESGGTSQPLGLAFVPGRYGPGAADEGQAFETAGHGPVLADISPANNNLLV